MVNPENQLIALLPRKDRVRLLGLCEQVPLVLSTVLCEPGETTRHVFFPTCGFISLVARVDGKSGLEVGMVGREGMLGSQVALGMVTTPLHAMVQGDGMAWRLGSVALRTEIAQSAALRRLLQRYIYIRMAQLVQSSGCLRFHQIGPRLARWLLMSQDRADSPHFQLTHEFLAYMLGVRRVGITTAAGILQRSGLIEYHHGALTVLDRSGLESVACSCYAVDRATYTRVLG